MITENMTLSTTADAHTWAESYNLSAEQTTALAVWIWNAKPAIGCSLADHPLSSMTDDEFWDVIEN